MTGLHAYRSPYWNPRTAGKDELASTTLIKGNSTSTPTPVILRASTPAPATAPVVAPSLDNELFKQFMKAYLEAQVPAQIASKIDPEPCKQPLKIRFLDLYYGNLDMDCYQFW